MSDWNDQIIAEFRANNGIVGGYFEGTTLLLLHTIGAKSGLERVNPVVYLPDGDDFVIIASKGGADTNPDWYYNLLANPKVTVEVGTEQLELIAHPTEEPERSQLYERMSAYRTGFAEYKEKTTRQIPVIRLSRS